MRLHDLLSSKLPILADGAMGTYFSELTGQSSNMCESANIDHPALVARIHQDYLDAGCKLIRTNTFAANTQSLPVPLPGVLATVKAGYEIAAEAAGGKAVVAADIGPIYSEDPAATQEEYRAIIDTFLDCGANCFIFETFADTVDLEYAISFILSKKPDAEIIASFAISPDGQTRSGVGMDHLIGQIKAIDGITMLGFNCGCGPTHLYNIISKLPHIGLPISAMPNTGYPSMENQRTVFGSSPGYFAPAAARLAGLGVAVIGGCCGTTPGHIAALGAAMTKSTVSISSRPVAAEKEKVTARTNYFADRLKEGKFTVAVELDPPNNSNMDKIIAAATMLKQAGSDIITVSDSPLARTRMDSVMCASIINRRCQIDVLPHLCCRDKNYNALRASVLGAHADGIRSVLTVTGDIVPEGDRGYLKPVFNLHSLSLMRMIQEMNRETFDGDPVHFGGAVNPNTSHPDAQLSKMEKKMECGASFFLSQPIFDEENFTFIERARKLGAKILVGVMPLVSHRNAHYMNNEVPGIVIPDRYLHQFTEDMPKETSVEIGVRIASAIAKRAKESSDGLYCIAPFNRADIICEILASIK